MKIINNRVVCSGCEEPFEVGQKFLLIQNKFIEIVDIGKTFTDSDVQGPLSFPKDLREGNEIFHEGCD